MLAGLASLSAEMKQLLTEQTSELNGEIRRLDEYYQSFVGMKALEDLLASTEDGFSPKERDAIMDQIEAIQGSDTARSTPGFADALEGIVSVLDAAYLGQDLDALDLLVGDVLQGQTGLSSVMAVHYGQRLIGGVLGPTRWKEEDVERFEKYEQALLSHNYSERAILFRILIEFVRDEDAQDEVVARMLESIQDLDPGEQAVFLFSVVTYSDAMHWSAIPNAPAKRIQATVCRWIEEYAQDLDEVLRGDLETASLLETLAFRGAEISPSLLEDAHRVIEGGFLALTEDD